MTDNLLFFDFISNSRYLKKGGELIMYTVLFVLGIAIFGYLMYVLVKPEKF